MQFENFELNIVKREKLTFFQENRERNHFHKRSGLLGISPFLQNANIRVETILKNS